MLAIWIGGVVPAAPQSAIEAGDKDAERQKYIEELEARLRALEKKFETLNTAAPPRQAPELTDAAKWAAKTKRADGRPGQAPAADPTAPPAPGAASPTAAESAAATPGTSGAPADISPGPGEKPAALASKEDADALRDLQVIRDSAVTVQQGKIEVSEKIDYVRSSSLLQYSQAFIATSTVRYGVFPGVELTLNVPVYNAIRKTLVSPTEYFKTEIQQLGDISGQVTATLVKETLSLPAIFGFISVSAPTGPDPYWVEEGEQPLAQPLHPLYFTQSSGHWAGTVGLTAAKVLEPIIVFGGVSYTHLLGRDFAGSHIEPGDRYGWRAGFGFAVSERTMLGAAVQGTITRDLVMDGTKRIGASAESVLLTLSLTQRIQLGFFIEPAVTVGMTNDAPSAVVSVTARKSF